MGRKAAMEVEDEILSEIEDRDTTIMIKNKEIEQNKQVIRSMVKMLFDNGISSNEISRQLSIPVEQIEQYIHS